MSVSMQFVRHSTIKQVYLLSPRSLSPSKQAYLRENTENFSLFEGLFVGFTGQTRTKLKRFRTVSHLLAYINKLSAGGWMNDDDYNLAWEQVLFLAGEVGVDPFC